MPMIKVYTPTEINHDKWDACVATHKHPLPYGFSWYLNALRVEWKGLVYGDYDAVMPIFPLRKKGFSYSTRPFGTQQVGIVAKIPITPVLVEQFVAAAKKECRYLELFFNHGTTLPKSWSCTSLMNQVLPLNKPYEQLVQGYSKRTKRNLKKSSFDPGNLGLWFTAKQVVGLWKASGKVGPGVQEAELDKLEKLIEYGLYQNKAELLAYTDGEGQLIAAQAYITHKGRATLLVNAATEEAKSNGIPTALIDFYISGKAGVDMVLDFEGSNLEGVQQFYNGFGAQSAPYHMCVVNALPFPFNFLKPKSSIK